MSLTKPQLLSTGAALRHAQSEGVSPADVERVTIDGVEVHKDEALGVLAEAEWLVADLAKKKAEQEAREKDGTQAPSTWKKAMRAVGSTLDATTGFVKRYVAEPGTKWIDQNVPVVNQWIEKASDVAQDAVASDPENVARRAVVRLSLKDGRNLEIPVFVPDLTAASILKAASVVAGGASVVPVFGNLVQGGTGLLCALASGVTQLVGDGELTRSLNGMAKKHLTLGLVGYVPGGSIISGGAAVRDAGRLAEGVPLDALVVKPRRES